MKGVFVSNQFEFRLEVKGENFSQGDTLPCVLSVKNHAADGRAAPALRLELGTIDLKKMKERKDDAFLPQMKAKLPALGTVKSQEQQSAPWTFTLPKNAIVSDKSQSLCFAYGSEEGVQFLPLTVRPHPHVQKIISVFESPFQFAVKGQKSSGEWVEVKMKPPSVKKLAVLDELTMGFKFDGDALDLRYLFKVKAFDPTETGVNVKKKKSSVEQRLETGSYLLTEEHLKHEVVEAKIEEALNTVATGI